MGRIISNKDIESMSRRDRRKILHMEDVKRVEPEKPILPKIKETKPDVLPLLVKAVDKSVQSGIKTSLVIAEALNRLGESVSIGKDLKPVGTVEVNKPWNKIEFTVTSRDYQGNLESFTAERVA